MGAAWDRRLRRIKEIAEAIGEKARKQAREQGQGQEQAEKKDNGKGH